MSELTYRVTTLGCRVNRADSLSIERELACRGYVRAGPDSVPDVWVVNTCAVTSEGMRKSRKAVRRAASCGARVLVTGCGADHDPTALSLEGRADVFGNKDKEALVQEALGDPLSSCDAPRLSAEELARVPVKVQDGCRRYCAYCLVPYLRPDPWSKPLSEVMAEVEALAVRGVGEAILCGIDLGTYEDPSTGAGLGRLVEAVSEKAPGLWLRLSSIELSDVDAEILEQMREGRLARHLHVPLQSGSASVLESMGRHYTPAEFSASVAEVRSALGEVAFTSDVMVGFPGETESDHEDSLAMVDELGFSRLHVFKYSRRRGTRAFSLEDTVSPEVKQRRADEMRGLASACAARFHGGQVGRIIPVLVEGAVRSRPGTVFGRAESFSGVYFEADEELVGCRAEVQVTGHDPVGMIGRLTGVRRGEQEGQIG